MLMPESLKVGGFDVLIAGTILAPSGKNIELTLPASPADEQEISIEFRFLNTDPPGESSIDWSVADQGRLILSLTNWRNPHGNTLLDWIHIGNYADRNLYFLFTHQTVGQLSPVSVLHYSLYLGEKVG
jgi:hypothetical protein